jgi:hypothetical protein
MIKTLNDYNNQTTQQKTPASKMLILESYSSKSLTEPLYAKQFIKPLYTLINTPIQVAHRTFNCAIDLENYLQFPTGQIWHNPPYFCPEILYISAHGIPAGLMLPNASISKNELISCFNGLNYYTNLVYFSACEVFAGDEGKDFAQEFLKKTGTMSIIGYCKEVPLIDSILIDLLFLTRFFEREENRFFQLHEIYESVIRDYPMAEKFGYKIFLKDE